jgi:hypothetical protein
MKATLRFIYVNKRYVGLAIGGLVLLAQNIGIVIPGEAPIDQTLYLEQAKDAIYTIAMVWLAHHDGVLKGQS